VPVEIWFGLVPAHLNEEVHPRFWHYWNNWELVHHWDDFGVRGERELLGAWFAVCCDAAAGECRLKTVVCAVERAGVGV
jgi:hypothetical protein